MKQRLGPKRFSKLPFSSAIRRYYLAKSTNNFSTKSDNSPLHITTIGGGASVGALIRAATKSVPAHIKVHFSVIEPFKQFLYGGAFCSGHDSHTLITYMPQMLLDGDLKAYHEFMANNSPAGNNRNYFGRFLQSYTELLLKESDNISVEVVEQRVTGVKVNKKLRRIESLQLENNTSHEVQGELVIASGKLGENTIKEVDSSVPLIRPYPFINNQSPFTQVSKGRVLIIGAGHSGLELAELALRQECKGIVMVGKLSNLALSALPKEVKWYPKEYLEKVFMNSNGNICARINGKDIIVDYVVDAAGLNNNMEGTYLKEIANSGVCRSSNVNAAESLANVVVLGALVNKNFRYWEVDGWAQRMANNLARYGSIKEMERADYWRSTTPSCKEQVTYPTGGSGRGA